MTLVPGGKQEGYSLSRRQLHDFGPKTLQILPLLLLEHRIDAVGRKMGRFQILKLKLIAIWTVGDSQDLRGEIHEIFYADWRFCTCEGCPEQFSELIGRPLIDVPIRIHPSLVDPPAIG